MKRNLTHISTFLGDVKRDVLLRQLEDAARQLSSDPYFAGPWRDWFSGVADMTIFLKDEDFGAGGS